MSATELGSTEAQPVSSTSASASNSPGVLSSLNPFNIAKSTLANGGLILIGVVLAIGALLISQKNTVVQVATTAARVAA